MGLPGVSSRPTSLIKAFAASFLIIASHPTPRISSIRTRVIG